MIQRATLDHIFFLAPDIHLLVISVKLQRLFVISMGVQVKRQLLNGKMKRLQLRFGSYRLFLGVDHPHEGQVKSRIECTADNTLSGIISGRILQLEWYIGIGQWRSGGKPSL